MEYIQNKKIYGEKQIKQEEWRPQKLTVQVDN